MQGYIITNEGDTIHGTIDYRSDAKNARECHFMAEGQDEYKTFVPDSLELTKDAYDKENKQTMTALVPQIRT